MDESTRITRDLEPAAQRPPSTSGAEPAGGQGGAVNAWRLLVLVVVFVALATMPYLVGKVVYQVRFNQLKAGADVASETLGDIKSRLSDFELASRMVAKRLEPSVVSIYRPGQSGGMGGDGQGSGVIVDSDGYIVTNLHVVRGARAIDVQLNDGRRTRASVVGADRSTDLAVLKIDLPNLIAAEWGDSDELEVGDLVWAVGTPFGLERSITFGIVSAKARRSGRSPYKEYLQTDAAVNPGNSGGPLVSIDGRVVGINVAIVGPSYQGVSFAIPSSLAQQEYLVMREKGWVDRAYLGILPTEVPQSRRAELGLAAGEGVYVGRVEPGAPADRAGLLLGDVILQWNDVAATDPVGLSRAIAATEVGSTAMVRVLRGDPEGNDRGVARTELELEVQVERHPWATQLPGSRR